MGASLCPYGPMDKALVCEARYPGSTPGRDAIYTFCFDERIIMKVYGTGLPRTGTTSLSKALEILGYDVVHYCPITNPNTKEDLTEDHQAYVSSELLLRININEGKWIFLHREDWLKSMWNIGEDLSKWKIHVKVWNNGVRNLVSDNVLHYRITDGWEPLCNFLGKPVPAVNFPRVNKS